MRATTVGTERPVSLFAPRPAAPAPAGTPLPAMVLHTVWRPASPHGAPALLFWAEKADAPVSILGGVGVPARHPNALARPIVSSLLPELPLASIVTSGEPTLWLPSRDGLPLPSTAPAEDARRADLHPWRVPVLVLRWAQDALELLPGVPAHLAAAGGAAGPGTRFWFAAAQLLASLLARGGFRPRLVERSWLWFGAWEPEPSPADRDALEHLANAMPAAARCYAPAGGAIALPSPQAALKEFMAAATDGFARRTLALSDPARPARRLPWLPPPPVAEKPEGEPARWLASLARIEPDQPLLNGWRDQVQLAGLRHRLDALSGTAQGSLAFRLLPPGPPLDLDGETETSLQGETWRLAIRAHTMHAQPSTSAGGPDAVGATPVAATGDKSFWVAELELAAHLFPPLAGCSMQRPEVDLSEADVGALLEWGAARLQEAGYTVELPEFLLHRRPARVATELSLQASRQASFDPGVLVAFQWRLAVDGATLGEDEFAELVAARLPFVRLGGRWVELRPGDLEAARRLWAARNGTLESGAALRAALDPEPEAPVDLPVEGVRGEGWLGGRLERLRDGTRLEPVPAPSGLSATLRPYQTRGLSWLAFLAERGLGGCLADDMGLGKTVQLLALVLHRRERGSSRGPTLVVCPASVVANWEAEAARFAAALRTRVHHGSGRRRGEALAEEAAAADLLLTSYETAYSDTEALSQIAWDGVVLDEAQRVKNPSGKRARALRQIPCAYRVVLTGTPVENTLIELWAHFAFLLPGYLGSLTDFRSRYARPVEREGNQERAAHLRHLIGPFLLRRSKADPEVAPELPPRIVTRQICALTAEQASLYAAVLQEMTARLQGAQGMARRGIILATLTRLKQVCNHPAHLTRDGAGLAGRSGKLDRLLEILTQIREAGEQALVFTQFVAFGRRLAPHLQERLGCPVEFLHGGLPLPERAAITERIQTGRSPIGLISLRAGGVGLNLTAASQVLHFDRWWNPAVEDQASDRAHRIGQQRTVQVHLLISRGTLEERIDRLLEEKRDLAGRIVQSGDAWLTELSDEELRGLLALDPAAVGEE